MPASGLVSRRAATLASALVLAAWTAAGIGLCEAGFAAAPPDDEVEQVPPGQLVFLPQLVFPPMGRVAVVRPSGTPTSVAIFLSGDGGWNKGVVGMADVLAGSGTLVLGVNTPAYIKAADQVADEKCHSVAVDLQMLSQYAQRRFGFGQYIEPVLVGYSSGAALAYAALAESPASFRGALGLGFTPDLYNRKPYCRNVGLQSRPASEPGDGHVFEPTARLGKPWIVLQGLLDEVAIPATTRSFVRQVQDATLVELPKVGHGFSVYRNWGPQYEEAFRRLAGPVPAAAPAVTAGPAGAPRPGLEDLPLTRVTDPRAPITDSFAIFLSGDGGWADFDQSLAHSFAARGVPVVGWSTLAYFWSKKTPEQAAGDLSRVIDHFSREWGRPRVALVGYSYGADTLPFMVDGLPDRQKAEVGVVALLSPGHGAHFRFSPLDWFNARKSGLPTIPAILKLDRAKVMCIYGVEDRRSVCPALPAGAVTEIRLAGGHHLGGDYGGITTEVLGRLGIPPTRQ